jgi:signal transduction histidine kinase
VAMYDGSHFHKLVGKDGNSFPKVAQIMPTEGNGLWLEASGSVIQIPEIPRHTSDAVWNVSYRSFDTQTDFPSQLYRESSRFTQTAVQGKDGKLWFLTRGGAAVIDPSRLVTNREPPPVSIRSLTADGLQYPTFDEVKLPSSSQNISFDYTALSLTNPELNQFRYQLMGFDRNWQDANHRRQAFYTNLPPGRYTFRVLASNNDGIWSTTGAAVVLTIPPTFVQTIWFKLICLASFVLALIGIFVLRMRHVEDRVRSRFSERLFERERVARDLHDTLLQGFQGLMLRFQTATSKIPEGEPARAMMESALDRADGVLLEGRNRVKDLRTGSTAASTLVDALRAVGDRFASGQETQFSVISQGEIKRLHALLADEFYQVGREAIANAFLHGAAQTISVEVSFQPNTLRLSVRDDGVGMSDEIVSEGRPGHFGLSGMRERSQAIGATFRLRSVLGSGTQVEISAPARIAYVDRGKLPSRLAARLRSLWVRH